MSEQRGIQMSDMKDRVALITGASSGIGRIRTTMHNTSFGGALSIGMTRKQISVPGQPFGVSLIIL